MTLALAAALLTGQGQIKPIQINPQTKHPVVHILPSVLGTSTEVISGPGELDQRLIDCLKSGDIASVGKDFKAVTGAMVKIDGAYRAALVQAGLESAAQPYSPENLEKLRGALGLSNLAQISLTSLKMGSKNMGLGKTSKWAEANGTLVFTPPFRSMKSVTHKISGAVTADGALLTKQSYAGAVYKMCRQAAELMRPWVNK